MFGHNSITNEKMRESRFEATLSINKTQPKQ